MKFILGKKLGMTQTWKDGKIKPVTKVQAGPCVVVQVKTEKTDGYDGVQLGFGTNRKEKNIRKPQLGHLKKVSNLGKKINFESLREFRLTKDENGKINIGDIIKADTFEAGDIIGVTGVSKGKGFAGVVKRHGFKGSKKTHGNKDQLRMPGSVGATGPAHVFKGTRMGGRMGNDQVTTKNLEIIEVDIENNIISIKGAIPGGKNGLVLLQAKGELKFEKQPEVKEEIKEEKKEETKIETEAVESKEVKAENNNKENEKEEKGS